LDQSKSAKDSQNFRELFVSNSGFEKFTHEFELKPCQYCVSRKLVPKIKGLFVPCKRVSFVGNELKKLKRMIKKHTFSLVPVIRGLKKGNGNLVAVYLRITVDGVVKEISTKTFVQTSKWNPVKGKVNGNTEDARILNDTIKSFERRAGEVYNRCIESGKLVTADLIKDEVLGLTHKSQTLVDQFDQYVAKLEAKKGVDYAPGTVTNWRITAFEGVSQKEMQPDGHSL
jgi:hypothetical protein